MRDQKTYRWYGSHVGDYPVPDGFTLDDLGKCDHAIQIPNDPNAWEIGVVRRRDGRPGYTLMWDFFSGGGGLVKHVGKDCGQLKQMYATAVATKFARAQGYRINEQVQKNGSIQLRLSK